MAQGPPPIVPATEVDPGPLPGPAEPPTPTAAAPRRRRWPILVAAVVVAAVLVVALVLGLGLGGFYPSALSPPPVLAHVNLLTLEFFPSHEPCFAAPFQSTHAESVVAGGELLYNVSLENTNPGSARACTVTNLSVNTTGFSIASSNAPLVIGTGPTTLTFALAVPTTAFNGSVVVDANVTYQTPNVQVSAQNFQVTGGAGQCGSVTAAGIGFSAFSGSTYSDSALVVSISPLTSCAIAQVAVVGAPGFSIASSNVPVPLPIDSFTSLTFQLNLPTTPYQGELNFTLTLS